jgi:1-acyl-sn-glycerol-3-phosphate acyltransferase
VTDERNVGRRTELGDPMALRASGRQPVFSTTWARRRPARVLRELVNLHVYGLDELRLFSTPALIVANHASHLDTAVLLSSLPSHRRRRTAVAAAADYFFDTWWRAGGSAIAFNTFPIERGHGTRLTAPGELLADGWSVIVYPEGTRSPDGFVGRFKLEAAWLAVQHRVPVIPVGLRGTYSAMPRGSAWPTRGRPRVSVRYGPPIIPGSDETGRQLASRIEAAVDGLVREDATSWWAAQHPDPRAGVDPPSGSWRRTWAQSEAPTEGDRPRRPTIWRS